MLNFLKLYRKNMIIGALIGLLLGTYVVLKLENKYSTYMTILSTQNALASTQKTAQTTFSIVGGILSTKEVSGDFAAYFASFKSPEIAAELIKHDKYVNLMFPTLHKDRLSWLLPELITNYITTPIFDLVFGPKTRTVSPVLVAGWLGEEITFDDALRTTDWTLSMRTAQPEVAEEMLLFLHKLVEKKLRDANKLRVDARINYLKEGIATSSERFRSEAMRDIITEQERIKMLLSIETAYAAEVIIPPYSSIKPTWPPRLLIMLIVILAGATLAVGPQLFRLVVNRAPE